MQIKMKIYMLNAVKIHNVHISWGFVMTAVRLSYQAVYRRRNYAAGRTEKTFPAG